MGRISASHVAGLDLIDKLFFNQTLVQCLFEDELIWLMRLNEDLDRELTGRNLAGVQRQVVKHCVLCMMEIELADSLLLLKDVYQGKLPELPENIGEQEFAEAERYKLDFFQGMLLASMSMAHQCDAELVVEITNALLETYRKAPATVRFRLVDRMFAFEFVHAPVDCFTWLSKMGVLDSSKHPGVGLEAMYTPDFLQRLALLCELDMHRDYNWRTTRLNDQLNSGLYVKAKGTSQESKKLLLKQEVKRMEVIDDPKLMQSIPGVSFGDLEKSASIQSFFANLNTYSLRFRCFHGSLASWIGMLCGGSVEILHRNQDQKKPIYAAESIEKSWTELISNGMSARGFEITARTIYERHRDFKETILKVASAYYHVLQFQNMAPPPNMVDIAYQGLFLHCDLYKTEPRRHARQRA